MLPEEKEVARLEGEQAELREQVTSAELALETAKTEIAQFQQRYYGAVGRLFSQLDKLDAEIAKARVEQAPADPNLRARAQSAQQQAEKSAEEAGLIEAQPKPPPEIAPDLKQAYRRAAKMMHPDLAISEHERQRRTELMALVNVAYGRGDQAALEKLIVEFGQDPEAIVGEDIGSRIVKAFRRIAQLRRRLSEVQQEMEALQKSEISRLRQTIEKAEAIGEDPLGDLEKQLMKDLSERQFQLNAMRQETR